MALHTLGTKSTTSLQCSPPWGGTTAAPLSSVDIAALDQSIVDDGNFGSILAGQSFGITATIATGTTANASSLLAAVTAITGPPVSQIHVGDLVLGIGVPLGTFVTVAPGATSNLNISQNGTTSSASTQLAFVRLNVSGLDSGGLWPPGIQPVGTLQVPNRGNLIVLPGDRVAVDNTGFPILVSGNSIGYVGSQWTFT
jgi:hypothetical protein